MEESCEKFIKSSQVLLVISKNSNYEEVFTNFNAIRNLYDALAEKSEKVETLWKQVSIIYYSRVRKLLDSLGRMRYELKKLTRIYIEDNGTKNAIKLSEMTESIVKHEKLKDIIDKFDIKFVEENLDQEMIKYKFYDLVYSEYVYLKYKKTHAGEGKFSSVDETRLAKFTKLYESLCNELKLRKR